MELVKSFTEHDGKFYVSTKQIAERFGKQHKDVLRKYSLIVKQLEELQLTDIIRRSFAPSNFIRLHDGYSVAFVCKTLQQNCNWLLKES